LISVKVLNTILAINGIKLPFKVGDNKKDLGMYRLNNLKLFGFSQFPSIKMDLVNISAVMFVRNSKKNGY
jgi:hypothetical protein